MVHGSRNVLTDCLNPLAEFLRIILGLRIGELFEQQFDFLGRRRIPLETLAQDCFQGERKLLGGGRATPCNGVGHVTQCSGELASIGRRDRLGGSGLGEIVQPRGELLGGDGNILGPSERDRGELLIQARQRFGQ